MNKPGQLYEFPDLSDWTLPQLTYRLVEQQDWSETDRSLVLRACRITEILFEGRTHRGKPYQFHNVRVGLRLVDKDFMGLSVVDEAVKGVGHDGEEDHASGIIELYNDRRELFGHKIGRRILLPEHPEDQMEAARLILEETFGEYVARGVHGVSNPPYFTRGKTRTQKISDARLRVRQAIKDPDCWALKLSDVTDHATDVPAPGSLAAAKLEYYNAKNYVIMDELAKRLNADNDVLERINPKTLRYFTVNFEKAFELLTPSQRAEATADEMPMTN